MDKKALIINILEFAKYVGLIAYTITGIEGLGNILSAYFIIISILVSIATFIVPVVEEPKLGVITASVISFSAALMLAWNGMFITLFFYIVAILCTVIKRLDKE